MMVREWGLLIACYLFLGGLSAGLLVISSVATLSRRDPLDRVARTAAWIAPWPVLFGTGLLVLDLGQPFYFWKLLLALAPRSPMWIGTWLLTIFSAISIPYAYLHLPGYFRIWNPRDVPHRRRQFAAAACAIGVGVGIYTGILLGVLVARPLWNTPLLAQLFLVSAVSSAAALLLVILRHTATEYERTLLARGDAVLIACELVVIAWMLLDAGTSTAASSAAMTLLIRGVYGWAFWGGVILVGLVLPLTLELSEARRPHASPASWIAHAASVAPILVLLGGFTLRVVIVFAGQASRLS